MIRIYTGVQTVCEASRFTALRRLNAVRINRRLACVACGLRATRFIAVDQPAREDQPRERRMSSDLEVFLQQYDDLVLVSLWEENCEASAYMVQLLENIEQLRRVPVLKLLLAEHREWANQHGVHGTPALIIYYRHQPLFRVVGRVTPKELFRCFQNLQLESQSEPMSNRCAKQRLRSHQDT
jgi:hypothetical protein